MSQALLDERTLLTYVAYEDLNSIRVTMCMLFVISRTHGLQVDFFCGDPNIKLKSCHATISEVIQVPQDASKRINNIPNDEWQQK